MNYSIIIPVFNEENCLPVLLKQLYPFSKNNEIIFLDDGSDDNSYKILQKIDYIKLFKLSKNFGKGVAIRSGIKKSKFSKIIIYDGDLELETSDLRKLMVLNKKRIFMPPLVLDIEVLTYLFQNTIGATSCLQRFSIYCIKLLIKIYYVVQNHFTKMTYHWKK